MKNKTKKLSIVIAVHNEEENIGRCLESVKEIADEIIIVDDYSEDKTVDIAKTYGSKIFQRNWENNFHENKQFGIDNASGDWILQLDADEVVTPGLADEIENVINSYKTQLNSRATENLSTTHHSQLTKHKIDLFKRYEQLIREREGSLGKRTGNIVAFFIPRKNVFLGKPITYGGVYPDAVIRLFKKGKARLPGESVHELMEVDGRVGWLFNDLLHYDSPSFGRYFSRWNRYTDLIAKEFEDENLPANYLYLGYYSTIKPLFTFLDLYIRHKGILDGFRGFVWSIFSALRFPISYFKYYSSNKK